MSLSHIILPSWRLSGSKQMKCSPRHQCDSWLTDPMWCQLLNEKSLRIMRMVVIGYHGNCLDADVTLMCMMRWTTDAVCISWMLIYESRLVHCRGNIYYSPWRHCFEVCILMDDFCYKVDISMTWNINKCREKLLQFKLQLKVHFVLARNFCKALPLMKIVCIWMFLTLEFTSHLWLSSKFQDYSFAYFPPEIEKVVINPWKYAHSNSSKFLST